MKVLKGILNESKEYYLKLEKDIKKRLSQLPKGNIKKRNIKGNIYYYLQQRIGKRVVHSYLGKSSPKRLIKAIDERKMLIGELRKVNEALKILKRIERKKHD